MMISRCSELLAILVEKPLRVTGRNKARLGRTISANNIEMKFELPQVSVNVCVMNRPMHVLNAEAMTKCVEFLYR